MAIPTNYDMGFEVPSGGDGVFNGTRNSFYVSVYATSSFGGGLISKPPLTDLPFETSRCAHMYGPQAAQTVTNMTQAFSPAVV